jgi:predicted nucleic acid-binding Zn ribbon protein
MTREINPISGELEAVKARLLSALPAEEAPLAAWSYVCGQRVAENARAVRYADQILTIAVADDNWRRELTNMAATYVAKLNQILPPASRVVRLNFEKSG